MDKMVTIKKFCRRIKLETGTEKDEACVSPDFYSLSNHIWEFIFFLILENQPVSSFPFPLSFVPLSHSLSYLPYGVQPSDKHIIYQPTTLRYGMLNIFHL
jgi:hypothetical protein